MAHHTATKTLRVVGGLILDGDRFLLGQRPDDDPLWPGCWEFPGGKVELGEGDKEALERELDEELALGVAVGRQLCRVELALDDVRILDFRVYVCAVRDGEPDPQDGQAVRWVTWEEALQLPLPEADKPALQAVRDEGLA